MRSLRFALLSLFAALCLHAATLQRLVLDEMIQKCTAIVRGQVVSSYAAPHGSLIYTHYRIKVTDRWKGPEAGELDIVVPGGVAGELRQTFPGAPTLAQGAEYVLFLWTGPSGLTHVMGLTQGLFSVRRDAGGETVAWRAASSEPMLDAAGRLVRDEALQLRLKDLRGRVGRVQARGGAQ